MSVMTQEEQTAYIGHKKELEETITHSDGEDLVAEFVTNLNHHLSEGSTEDAAFANAFLLLAEAQHKNPKAEFNMNVLNSPILSAGNLDKTAKMLKNPNKDLKKELEKLGLQEGDLLFVVSKRANGTYYTHSVRVDWDPTPNVNLPRVTTQTKATTPAPVTTSATPPTTQEITTPTSTPTKTDTHTESQTVTTTKTVAHTYKYTLFKSTCICDDPHDDVFYIWQTGEWGNTTYDNRYDVDETIDIDYARTKQFQESVEALIDTCTENVITELYNKQIAERDTIYYNCYNVLKSRYESESKSYNLGLANMGTVQSSNMEGQSSTFAPDTWTDKDGGSWAKISDNSSITNNTVADTGSTRYRNTGFENFTVELYYFLWWRATCNSWKWYIWV